MPITSAISALRQALPDVEHHDLSVDGLEPSDRVCHDLVVGVLHDDEHRVGGGRHPEVGELGVETPPSIEGSRLIRQRFAGDPVETWKGLGGRRYLVDATPHDEKRLGASVLGVGR